MTDPLFLGAFAGIGAAVILAYLLGRWHGMTAAFDAMRSNELPRDWPSALQGDLPNVPVHAKGNSR